MRVPLKVLNALWWVAMVVGVAWFLTVWGDAYKAWHDRGAKPYTSFD